MHLGAESEEAARTDGACLPVDRQSYCNQTLLDDVTVQIAMVTPDGPSVSSPQANRSCNEGTASLPTGNSVAGGSKANVSQSPRSKADLAFS